MQPFDTIVISDLHLGAPNSRHAELLTFLAQVETDHLILNGDVFDDAKLRGLTPADIEVADALRRTADRIRVTWIVGNHDPAQSWFTGLLGIEPRDEVVCDIGGRTYLICHGHQWDRSLNLPQWLINLADGIYRQCQRVDRSHAFARWIKHKCKRFVKAVQSLQRHAWQTACERGYAGVILGHTHVQGDVAIDGLHYLNSGCWTETPCGFVGIRDGAAQAYQWAARQITPLVARPEASVEEPAHRRATVETFVTHDDEELQTAG
jgi:UDP-2,3-diacylglucosamine pyrophosphatase LpxH